MLEKTNQILIVFINNVFFTSKIFKFMIIIIIIEKETKKNIPSVIKNFPPSTYLLKSIFEVLNSSQAILAALIANILSNISNIINFRIWACLY